MYNREGPNAAGQIPKSGKQVVLPKVATRSDAIGKVAPRPAFIDSGNWLRSASARDILAHLGMTCHDWHALDGDPIARRNALVRAWPAFGDNGQFHDDTRGDIERRLWEYCSLVREDAAPWQGAPYARESFGAAGQVRPPNMPPPVKVPPTNPYVTTLVATRPVAPGVTAETDRVVATSVLTAMQINCAQWNQFDHMTRLGIVRRLLSQQAMPVTSTMTTPGSMTTTPRTTGGPGGPGIPGPGGGGGPSRLQETIARAYQASQTQVAVQQARRLFMSTARSPEEVVAMIDRHCGNRTSTDVMPLRYQKYGHAAGDAEVGVATVLTAPPTLAEANATLAALAAAQTDLETTRVALAGQCRRSLGLLGATIVVTVLGATAYAMSRRKTR